MINYLAQNANELVILCAIFFILIYTVAYVAAYFFGRKKPIWEVLICLIQAGFTACFIPAGLLFFLMGIRPDIIPQVTADVLQSFHVYFGIFGSVILLLAITSFIKLTIRLLCKWPQKTRDQ